MGADPAEVLGVGADPELDYIKRRYEGAFRSAVEDAISALPPEQRAILRLHMVEGLSGDQIGGLLQVSRPTAQRRLLSAREAVQQETRRLLQERLGITPSEMLRLARLVRSQLNASLNILPTSRERNTPRAK